MAVARSEIVRRGEAGVYHCWTHCVRRAFLCGMDPLTGQNFEHEGEWLHQLQEQLAGFFGVEIAFHASMGNGSSSQFCCSRTRETLGTCGDAKTLMSSATATIRLTPNWEVLNEG